MKKLFTSAAPRRLFVAAGITAALAGALAAPVSALADLPSSYDLRETGEVTSAKTQVFDDCWAFASVGSLESSMLKNGATSADLSEKLTVWSMYGNPASETLAARLGASGQGGEGIYTAVSSHSPASTNAYWSSGFLTYAAGLWSSGQGLADESTVPYQSNDGYVQVYQGPVGSYTEAERLSLGEYNQKVESGYFDETYGEGNWHSLWSDQSEWSLSDELRNTTSDYAVESVTILENPLTRNSSGAPSADALDQTKLDAIKQTIVDTGAVAAAFNQSSDNRNVTGNDKSGRRSVYTATETSADHDILIVGWDDDYAVDNFGTSENGNAQPPKAGAWIVKNSAGSTSDSLGAQNTWGVDDGYFYISYYDQSLESFVSYEAGDKSEITLQHDLIGVTDVTDPYNDYPMTCGSETWVANVFTAPEDMKLESVSAHTYEPGTKVDVRIYLLDDGVTDISAGTLAAEYSTTVDEFYQTIDLSADKTVTLKKGQRFAVAESISTGSGDSTTYYVPFERAYTEEYANSQNVGMTLEEYKAQYYQGYYDYYYDWYVSSGYTAEQAQEWSDYYANYYCEYYYYGYGYDKANINCRYYGDVVINEDESYIGIADGSALAWTDATSLNSGWDADGAIQPVFSGTISYGNANIKVFGSKAEVTEPEPETHTVTFVSNGKTFTSVTVEDGKAVSAPSVSPSATGYTFTGWSANSTEYAEYDFSTPVTDDLTLTAFFTKNSSGSGATAKTDDTSDDTKKSDDSNTKDTKDKKKAKASKADLPTTGDDSSAAIVATVLAGGALVISGAILTRRRSE